MKEQIKKLIRKIDKFIESIIKYIIDEPISFIYYLTLFVLLIVSDPDFLLLFMTLIALRASLILDKVNKKLNRDSKLWINMNESIEKELNSKETIEK